MHLESYLKGLFDIVSYKIYPSFFVIETYQGNECFYFQKDLIEINDSLEDIFKVMINDKKMIETIFYLLEKKLGKYKKIYTINNSKVLDKICKMLPFFFLDDVYVIEYNDLYLCLYIGNNE